MPPLAKEATLLTSTNTWQIPRLTQFSALLKGIKWPVKEDFDIQNGRTLNNINGYSRCGADDVYLIQYTSAGTGIPSQFLSLPDQLHTMLEPQERHMTSIVPTASSTHGCHNIMTSASCSCCSPSSPEPPPCSPRRSPSFVGHGFGWTCCRSMAPHALWCRPLHCL